MAELRPCGTSAAYKRHLRHGETPCPECRAVVRKVPKVGKAAGEELAAREVVPPVSRSDFLCEQRDLVSEALRVVAREDPSRAAQLSKELREILREIDELAGDESMKGGGLSDFLAPGKLVALPVPAAVESA